MTAFIVLCFEIEFFLELNLYRPFCFDIFAQEIFSLSKYLKHNKEEVIQKGLQLFYHQGYNALGVDQICKDTKMTKGAFYHSFKSKEGFLQEVIGHYGDSNRQRIQKELHPQEEIKAIDLLLQFYINMLHHQPKVHYSGCFINNMMAELGKGNESIGGSCNREFVKFLEAIEPTVKQAQIQGDFPKDINSKDLTELIHYTFYGALTVAKCHQDADQSIAIIELLFNNLKSK